MTRSSLLLLAGLAAFAAPAAGQAPDRSAEVRTALEALPLSPGVWEGEAWYRQGPGAPDTIRQVERVESRLGGVVLLVEGIGRTRADEVVHHAFATVGWDPHQAAYFMTAWLAGGTVTDPWITLEDDVLTWGFDAGGDGPRVRYRITSPEPDVWHEEGEASMDDGATWHPFFGMTLTRTGDEEG